LQAAIHSQRGADAEILKRANICLAAYFDPDFDPETKAGVRESFVRALRDLPLWAVLRAFDAWEKSMQRRPSPGDIVILAERELKPITDELKRRQDAEQRAADEERWRTDNRVSAEAAAEIMRRAGFTAKRIEDVRRAPMALTFAEAESAKDDRAERHWSETAAPDDPRWAVLRASRDANPHVQAARASLARQKDQGAA
jgi:hypothetical protein